MRIWSLHPKYLDAKGLVALWRETLLAKHVLLGKTKGYRNHPQLNRFKDQLKPAERIDQYLSEVYHEANRRGYHFNKEKIDWDFKSGFVSVTTGQLAYERKHLLNKLKQRDKELYEAYKPIETFDPHPMFMLVPGKIEDWEIIS
jgi:Pyrimidine dimer DNA glycosylase